MTDVTFVDSEHRNGNSLVTQ